MPWVIQLSQRDFQNICKLPNVTEWKLKEFVVTKKKNLNRMGFFFAIVNLYLSKDKYYNLLKILIFDFSE